MEVQIGNDGNNRKKTATAVIIVLCALALLLTGTFAYYNIVNAVNEFETENDNGVVLHDDYDEDYDEDEDEYDKDVYVENTGDMDLFIRVRLEEYLELDGSYKLPSYAIYDEAQQEYINWHHHAYSETADSRYVCEDCGESFHAYFAWEMGNTDPQVFKRADEAEKVAGTAFRYVRNANGDMEDIWKNAAGGGSIPSVGGSYDTDVWAELPECEVISMAEYWTEVEKFEADPNEGLDPEEWTGWVLDTDGWAYWAQRLKSGETTGLLLSKVTKTENPPGEEYFYGIHAVLDAADGLDVGAWMDADQETSSGKSAELATAEAIKLLKAIGADE